MKVEYLRRLRKCKAITTEITQAIKRATPGRGRGRGRGPWPQLSGESTPSTLLYCDIFTVVLGSVQTSTPYPPPLLNTDWAPPKATLYNKI